MATITICSDLGPPQNKVCHCFHCFPMYLPLSDGTRCHDLQFSSFQSLSRVRLFATPWTAAHKASLSITNSWSLLKPMSIKSVMPSNHLILCHPLLLAGSPCSPRDSQKSSPRPQFKSINSSVLSFFYSPTVTSIHDYWKNHSFD